MSSPASFPAGVHRGVTGPEWSRSGRCAADCSCHRRETAVERRLRVQRLSDVMRVAVVDLARSGDDSRLAGESELMREYSVSRDVLRAALARLSDEGLIERRRGLGTVVVADSYTLDGTLPGVATSLTDHAGVGEIAATLVHWHRGPVPAVVAARLDGVDPDDPTLCMEYVLTVSGRPMGLITNYLRSAEAAGMRREQFVKDFYALLDAHDVDMCSHDIELAAQAADMRVADVLGVREGAPTQRFEQTIRDSSGSRFDFAIGQMRSEIRIRMSAIGRMSTTAHHGPMS